MNIKFSNYRIPSTGGIICFISKEKDLTLMHGTLTLDQIHNGLLQKIIKNSNFQGQFGEKIEIFSESRLNPIIIFGIGNKTFFDPISAQKLGAKVSQYIRKSKIKDFSILFDIKTLSCSFAIGAMLRDYSFNKYRTKENTINYSLLKNIILLSEDHKSIEKEFESNKKIIEGVFWTRDLVSEPSNILDPENFVQQVQVLTKIGIEIEILDRTKIQNLGMGAFLGVAQGSCKEPYIIIMKWYGNPNTKEILSFVGKGVTFDSGGLSLKPSLNMEEMKCDMGGAAVVVGLMKSLAARKAKCNIIASIGLVENMPSGTAQRPGDIVTSMSGQTIEVINTDAEGRLLLCDILTYVQKIYNPKLIIDLATLTGAVIVALGYENAGLFSNNDMLAEQLLQSANQVNEGLWRLPLSESYDQQLKSDIADMKNIGGSTAGAITAAQFLKRFITNNRPWAHIDIAGTTWCSKDSDLVSKGASGYGVQLLNQFILNNYEK